MRRHARLTLWLALAALLPAQGACAGAATPEARKAESMLNSTPHADRRNTSYLPVSGRLGQEIKWTRKIEDPDGTGEPLTIGYHDGKLIVHSTRALESIVASDGRTEWTEEVSPSFDFHMDSEGIATLNSLGRYRKLGFDGRGGLELLLPLRSEIVRLLAATRVKDELRYVFVTDPSPVNSPEMDSDMPSIAYHRLAYDTGDVRLRYSQENVPMASVEAGDGTVYLVSAIQIDWMPADAADATAVRSLDGAEFEAAAVDFDDRLLVVMEDDDGRTLRCYRDGTQVWSTPLGDDELGPQPPGSAPGGHTYLVLGSRLLHWENGALSWEHDIPGSGSDPAYFTVLEDRSVLLAAGRNVVHLSADGVEMGRVVTAQPVTCRPLMTPDGTVVVGTGSSLSCYH